MTVSSLARAEILALRPYVAAPQEHCSIRLNANEMPDRLQSGSGDRLNRYPPIRPLTLRDRLAQIYGVPTERLLVSRGSSEAIDLLIRVFCRPGQDEIVISPPTFGMYRVFADIQHAGVREVPLDSERGFVPDIAAIAAICDDRSKLIFVCSPNNPTGNSVSTDDLESLLNARGEQSLVIVDEAYIEFSDHPSVVPLLDRFDNLVVLRTLSKAYGLAAARVGSVVAHPTLIRLLDGVMAPYAFAVPVIAGALAALTDDRRATTTRHTALIVSERDRLTEELTRSSSVETVWPSDANFLLVRFKDLTAVRSRLEKEKILIRDFSSEAGLANCARITVGSPDENRRMLDALDKTGAADE
jgi:histidinol-phosphate aminotransferase